MTSTIKDYCSFIDDKIVPFSEGRSALNVNYRYYPSNKLAIVESFDPWIIPDFQGVGYDVICVDTNEFFRSPIKEENQHDITTHTGDTTEPKKKLPSHKEVMKRRIESLFSSGEFTRGGTYDSFLHIRHCKDYIAEYRLHFHIRSVKEFKEVLIEVLISCNHDILANKKGDYKCRRPSLYFGLYGR